MKPERRRATQSTGAKLKKLRDETTKEITSKPTILSKTFFLDTNVFIECKSVKQLPWKEEAVIPLAWFPRLLHATPEQRQKTTAKV